ncbi:serine/threonine protein kinase [Pseudenhygromyxa sp. WMMC2535]|uniref:serine/threonine-protein kinase n=1 Tax=Pseudenhygromyxa sp. WMMC2535 TaxID=2712867 RepID=UPI001552B3B9|nr:serine/threonine-protein kinase [Pseudenhygromyxa sp. WMMC2535]NVB39850.1 serine/threonine protein kinase [Pseudenhygromyxa sp. WMMC2535]
MSREVESTARLAPCPHCGETHGEDLLRCPNTDMPLDLEGRRLDKKFRLVEALGVGGMATVWLAINERVDREVAIKFLRPEIGRDAEVIARFRSEAKAAGRIGSENICEIIDLGESPIGPYMVMERLRGIDLAGLIKRQGLLQPGYAVRVVRHALEGLVAAHEAGIVHRDLKPGNVFLHKTPGGETVVKLMDFGVSKFLDGTGEAETKSGILLGTPEYMAPEQLDGAHKIGPAADIFAMGAILYRAITGHQVFSGPNLAAVIRSMAVDEVTPISQLVEGVPPELEAVIHKALERDPDKRHATASELSEALLPFESLDVIVRAFDQPESTRSVAIHSELSPVAAALASQDRAAPAEASESAGADVEAEAEAAPDDLDPGVSGVESTRLWREGEAARADRDPGDSMAEATQLHEVPELEAELEDEDEAGEEVEAEVVGSEDAEVASEAVAASETAEEVEAESETPASDAGSPAPASAAELAVAAKRASEVAVAEESRSRAGVWIGVLVGLAALVGVFVVGGDRLFGGSEQGESDDVALVEDAAQLEAGTETETGGLAAGDMGALAMASETGEAETGGTETGTGETETGTGETETGTDTDTDTGEAQTETGDEDVGDESGGDPAFSTERPAPADTVRGGGFITPLEAPGTTDFTGAKAACEALAAERFAGVSSWSLANPAQLAKFFGSRELKRGRYWSSAVWQGKAKVYGIPGGKRSSEKIGRNAARPFCVSRW